MIRPVDHIASMSGYALAQLSAPEGARLISLSQNESIRPPSPLVAETAAKAMADGHLYPDPDWQELRQAISELNNLHARDILCGAGSMDLIAAIAVAFADEGRAILTSEHAYPFFRTAAQLARARYDTAPERELTVSVEALLEAVRPDTALVFVANPANPTGTRISRAELLRLREGLPDSVLLVIDEAYGEFADHLGEPLFDLVNRGDTVVLRSFSKAYGLAGARVGWGLFPPAIAHEVRKVMAPNNISAASQAAAVAAVRDQTYMLETCAITASLRTFFCERAMRLGLEVTESHTNFVLMRTGSADRARRIDQCLRDKGIILRAQGGVGLADCLRLTIGSEDDLSLTADLLGAFAKEEG